MIPIETWVLPRPRKDAYVGSFPLHFEQKLWRLLGEPDPVLHAGFKAHFADPYAGVVMCIRCDGPPTPPPLTLEEWLSGEGGEDRRNEFEADWDAVLAKTATPEQVERFRYAIGATDEAVNAVAGAM